MDESEPTLDEELRRHWDAYDFNSFFRLVQERLRPAICNYLMAERNFGLAQWDLSAIGRNSEVFVANANGSNEVNLSKNAAFDGWPVWSPDGKRIAFSSNRVGPANTGQIFVVNTDGSGLRQLTSGPGGFAQPSWSWDGRRIVAYQNWETAEHEYGNISVIEFN